MSQPNKFWVYFIIFMFFCNFYIIQSFWGNESLNAIFQNMFILVGMAYGIYLVHSHGYMEGLKDGKTESNKTLRE